MITYSKTWLKLKHLIHNNTAYKSAIFVNRTISLKKSFNIPYLQLKWLKCVAFVTSQVILAVVCAVNMTFWSTLYLPRTFEIVHPLGQTKDYKRYIFFFPFSMSLDKYREFISNFISDMKFCQNIVDKFQEILTFWSLKST